MPKTKTPSVVRMSELLKEFKDESVELENGSLFCSACAVSLTMDKFRFKQDITSLKHKSNCALKSRHQTISNTVGNDDFSNDLCEAFIAANIPFYKLNNPMFRKFLEDRMHHKIPNELTVRKNDLHNIYEKILQKIRDDIGENSVFVSIDETTDKEGRYIANVIVGALHIEEPAWAHLIHLKHLEVTNAQTIAEALNNGLKLLWNGSIKHDQVLLMVTDAAEYMKKAGKDLKILFTNMVHVTCLAHGLHRLADHICCNFSKADDLVKNIKKIFWKSPYRTQLLKRLYPELPLPPEPVVTRWGTWIDAVGYYFQNWVKIRDVIEQIKDKSIAIKRAKELFQDDEVMEQIREIGEHYLFLTVAIVKLQDTTLPMTDSLRIWDDVITKIELMLHDTVKKKMQNLDTKNKGLKVIRAINSKEMSEIREFFNDPKPKDIASFKYAPLVSVDVERSFSLYKQILTDYHPSFVLC